MLAEHGVAFIVIGGIAAAAHGSSQVTFDLDMWYERSRDELDDEPPADTPPPRSHSLLATRPSLLE